MPTSEEIHRAEAAKQLLANDVFAEALSEIGNDALLQLGEVDPIETDEIRRLQAVVKVVRDFPGMLQRYITQTGERDGGYSLTK